VELQMYRGKVVKLAEITLAPDGALTGDTKTDPKSVMQFKEGTFFLRHAAIVGAVPTLDVEVHTKDPAPGEHWYKVFAFSPITTAPAGGEKKDVPGAAAEGVTLGENICITWDKKTADVGTTFTVYAVLKI
ncbi:unnamed protein product, partial [marine sediment metagenome]